MYKIKELKRMMPEGSWSWDYKKSQLVDPNGNRHTLFFGKLTAAEEKLYGEYICELLNRTPHIIWDLDWRIQQVAGLFRELKHRIEKTNQAYVNGIEDAADVISNIQATSPTSRDALNEAIDKLDALRTQAKATGRNEIPSRITADDFQGTARV